MKAFFLDNKLTCWGSLFKFLQSVIPNSKKQLLTTPTPIKQNFLTFVDMINFAQFDCALGEINLVIVINKKVLVNATNSKC